MAAVLPPENFARWLDRFLPDLHDGEPAKLFTPGDGQQSRPTRKSPISSD